MKTYVRSKFNERNDEKMNLTAFDTNEDRKQSGGDGTDRSARNKKGRGSVLVSLGLSIFAAIALWLFVVAENNTCSGISIQVSGIEQLMSYNYTVSAIEPSTIELVLKGKNDQIDRILSDKSLVAATIHVFAHEGEEGNCLFSDVTQIKAGEYVVDVDIVLPEGVTCNTKSVKVTVSETFSRVLGKDDFRINLSNYSFGNGFSKAEEFVRENSLTVSGDEGTVSRISYIGLNIDWLKEVTDDVEAVITPVAYDSFGGVIDTKFLRFEPAQLNVAITVNKSKNFPLVLRLPEGDTGVYTLSRGTVRLIGPVALIDKIGDEIVLNEDQNFEQEPEIRALYTLEAGRFGSAVRIVEQSGNTKSLSIQVTRTEGTVQEEIVVPLSAVKIFPPEGKIYTVLEEELRITVEYSPDKNEKMTSDDLLVFLDLTNMQNGQTPVTPTVSWKPSGKFQNVRLISVSRATVNISDLPQPGGDSIDTDGDQQIQRRELYIQDL